MKTAKHWNFLNFRLSLCIESEDVIFSDFIPSVKNELCIHKIYMLLFRECAWFWQKIVIKCEERRILEFHIFAFSISTRAIGAEVSDLMILMVGRVKRFFFASVGWARLQYRILERERSCFSEVLTFCQKHLFLLLLVLTAREFRWSFEAA